MDLHPIFYRMCLFVSKSVLTLKVILDILIEFEWYIFGFWKNLWVIWLKQYMGKFMGTTPYKSL